MGSTYTPPVLTPLLLSLLLLLPLLLLLSPEASEAGVGLGDGVEDVEEGDSEAWSGCGDSSGVEAT
jgi:hypothetical protein